MTSQEANGDLALILSPTPERQSQLTDVLQRFYSQVEIFDGNHDFAALLLMEYGAALDLPDAWRVLQNQGTAVLLLIPERDTTALDYALECGVDDYVIVSDPLDTRVVEHRIRRVKQMQEARREHQSSETMLVEALQSTALALSSTLEFDTVLDRILIHLERVIPYDLADVVLVENGMATVVRHRGYNENGLSHIVAQMRFPAHQFKTLSMMAATGKPLYVPDTHQFEGWSQIMEEMNWRRSYLGAPLFVNDRLVGFLNLNNKMLNAYTPEDSRRLGVFASQVSVAISNAQLHDTVIRHSVELEQRIRDLIVVYEIGQALTSTFDLKEIYFRLYKEVVQGLFGAPEMRVALLDQETHQPAYDFAIAEGEALDASQLELLPEDRAYMEQVIHFHQSTIRGSSIYEPLISRNRVIGVIQVLHYNADNFDEVDVTLLSTVATLAAVAVENAQLYAMVHDQHEEMAALYRATTLLFVADNLPALAQQVTEAIINEFQQSECGLLLLDKESGSIVRIARSGDYRIETSTPLLYAGEGLVPEAMRSGQIVYAPDVTLHPRYVVGDPRTQSELVIPLHTSSGVIGVLDLQSKELAAFSERDLRVLQTFAERAAIALENMRLMDEIRRHAADLEQRVLERTDELRDALEKERELSELKTRFIMTVSHQFRTPLTAIQSAKEMLKNYGERMTIEQRNQRYEMLDNAVTDMVRLIEDSTMMNRMTGGDLILTPVLIDLHSFTRDIINDFAARSRKSHRIVYASDTKEAFNLVDGDMWRKVVYELLLNATKFSAEGTTVDCELSTIGSEFIFTIMDEGMGIEPSDLGRIFGVFDRGANVENIPGAGLGLAIVKQSIERHGGAIYVTSQLGVGTTVTLHLPKYVLEGVR